MKTLFRVGPKLWTFMNICCLLKIQLECFCEFFTTRKYLWTPGAIVVWYIWLIWNLIFNRLTVQKWIRNTKILHSNSLISLLIKSGIKKRSASRAIVLCSYGWLHTSYLKSFHIQSMVHSTPIVNPYWSIYIQQSTSTDTWTECKKIEKQPAFTFVFMVCSLQIRKYKWLISKSSIDLLNCMIIASCSHFELTIFSFNPGHLLNSCADIENLNSMQWMGQPVLSIEHVFYIKKKKNLGNS